METDVSELIAPPRKMREFANHHMDSRFWNGFPFRDGDVVVSTYAKSGTTWTQQIVGQLIFKGDSAVKRIFWNDLRFVGAISVLGLPVAVTSAGLVEGTPVGVQLIGSRYREDVCLEAAAAIEARVGVLAHTLWARPHDCH